MKRTLIAALLLVCPLITLADGATTTVPQSQIDTYKAYVEWLAADERDGRGLGTKGVGEAADWIEENLRSHGLQPVFDGSYRQTFEVKTGVEMIEGNEVAGLESSDWTPLGFSSSGEFDGELAFLGYGIDAEPLGYRELDGIDLAGKVALILRYEPQERDDASPFDGRRPSRWSSMRYKVLQARERGAAAVIFVTGPIQDENKDHLPMLKNDGPESPAGLPVVQVKTSVAQAWLSKAGIDLEAFQQDVDRDLTPRSNGSTGIKVKGRVALRNTYVDAQNVAAKIPGRGSAADEIVVIGAHYDHLGMGGERSMRPNEEAVHNGADDNASGTAAVLLAAERIKKMLAGVNDHRTVVLALFSAEEVGLAGSSNFVENAPFPMGSVVAMINLDMVGALQGDDFAALGADSAEEWKEAVDRVGSKLGLTVSSGGDGYGPSDQTSFYAAGVPVLHFFTGTHDRYHTPDDDAEFINFEGGARIAEYTAMLASEVARRDLNPKYASAGTAPAMQGDARGYGAYMGTVPDYRAMEATEGGVLLSDVRKGGPADLAGIKGGDTLVQMAGTRIENLYDMTFALQDSKPGDTIDVVVIRDGERVTLRATLGDRRTRAQTPPAAEKKEETGPAEKAAAAAPAAASPHAMPPGMGGDDSGEFKLPEFYVNRPGKDFVIGAGKPFDRQYEGEPHLSDIRQLTFSGENAEAYFSPDGSKLIYQATREQGGCDQQYILDLVTGETTLVSGGKGRTTCGYYDWPEADRLIWASTVSGGDACPPVPDRSEGYVWPVFASYELYTADLDGSNVRRLTENDAYDAEATWCHRGGKLVFTSDRDGDLELYEMDEAGNVKRLTNAPGYDGGAFYSPDCSEIVWRAIHPEGEELEKDRALLARHMVRPSKMELWVMDADGTNQRQITQTGAANFGPYFHPDGKRIIYSYNHNTGVRHEFELFLIDKEGGEPKRITTAPGFDGFPQFSPDGEWLVWGSNRANEAGGFETNLFIAKWVE
jgi:Tol biopolymer transport system component